MELKLSSAKNKGHYICEIAELRVQAFLCVCIYTVYVFQLQLFEIYLLEFCKQYLLFVFAAIFCDCWSCF